MNHWDCAMMKIVWKLSHPGLHDLGPERVMAVPATCKCMGGDNHASADLGGDNHASADPSSDSHARQTRDCAFSREPQNVMHLWVRLCVDSLGYFIKILCLTAKFPFNWNDTWQASAGCQFSPCIIIIIHQTRVFFYRPILTSAAAVALGYENQCYCNSMMNNGPPTRIA